MAVFFRICGIVVLLTFWGGVTGGALASAPTKPQDAVVFVTSHWRGNYALSHGVAVGDGVNVGVRVGVAVGNWLLFWSGGVP